MKGRRHIPFLQLGIPTSKTKMTKTWKAADKQKLTIADRSFKFTLTLFFDPRHIFKTASELQKLIKNNLNVSTHSQ